MLKVGIVGLPNVGKSTLFNALLKKQVALAANYPFATIDPNVGVVEVPDERLEKLAEVVHTNTIVPAVVEFYDIAGLVKGASEGEGLGNKFLNNIRETDLIAHVVRFFVDPNITHVDDQTHPARDIETVETELILSDLNILEKQKSPKGKASKEDILRWNTIEKLRLDLSNGIPARNVTLSEDELESIRQYNLLTLKPVLYVFNLSEEQLMDIDDTKERINRLLEEMKTTFNSTEDYVYTYLSAKLEFELVLLDPQDQQEYLQQFGLDQTGLNRLVTRAYQRLGLVSFLTAGEKEVRAWTVKEGATAQEASGVIHTDFIKHFVKAEMVRYQDFIDCNGWPGARESGKIILAGKEYPMADGYVVEFKINLRG